MSLNSGYKKITDYESFTDNPFMEKAVSDIRVVRKTQIIRPRDSSEIQQIVSEEGEVTGYSAFMRFIEVDEERFAKLYLNQFASFWDLSSTAIRVFGYIIHTLKPKQDTFNFDLEECLNYTKYRTKKSVFEGLAALIECGIIARSNRHYKYFINPLVVFNGDRVTFAKTYVKKKKAAADKQLDKTQLNLFSQQIDSFEEKQPEESSETSALNSLLLPGINPQKLAAFLNNEANFVKTCIIGMLTIAAYSVNHLIQSFA